jgi:hypothetical protein
LEAIQHIVESLARGFAYLIVFSLFGLVTFAMGFAFASLRGRKKKESKPTEFESLLLSLEVQIGMTEEALEKLSLATRVPIPPSPEVSTGSSNYIGPSRWEKLRKFFSMSRHSKEPDEAMDAAVTKRFQKTADDIKDIRNVINYIRGCFDKKVRDPYQSPNTSKDLVSTPNSVKQPTRNDEQIPAGLFAPNTDSISAYEIESLPDPYAKRAAGDLDGFQEAQRTHATQHVGSEIIDLYNQAVIENTMREEFRETYRPFRIGTVNAEERTKNPTIDSDFRETTDGDFFAIPIARKDGYAVFPRLGLTIEAVSYGAGAVGEVFKDTPNYNPKLFYSHYRVKEPAIFRREGDRWKLESPGELILGTGD